MSIFLILLKLLAFFQICFISFCSIYFKHCSVLVFHLKLSSWVSLSAKWIPSRTLNEPHGTATIMRKVLKDTKKNKTNQTEKNKKKIIWFMTFYCSRMELLEHVKFLFRCARIPCYFSCSTLPALDMCWKHLWALFFSFFVWIFSSFFWGIGNVI